MKKAIDLLHGECIVDRNNVDLVDTLLLEALEVLNVAGDLGMACAARGPSSASPVMSWWRSS